MKESMKKAEKVTRKLSIIGAAFIVVSGCAPRFPSYATPIEAASSLEPTFMARQEIAIRFRGRELRLQAVLQNHGGQLVLLALGSMGTRSFTITQDGVDIAFESFDGTELPIPPRFIVFDVHRALFYRETQRPRYMENGETVEEVSVEESAQNEGGRVLRRRVFRRGDDHIEIDYEPAYRPGAEIPARIVLDNGYLGYTIEIETLSFDPLE